MKQEDIIKLLVDRGVIEGYGGVYYFAPQIACILNGCKSMKFLEGGGILWTPGESAVSKKLLYKFISACKYRVASCLRICGFDWCCVLAEKIAPLKVKVRPVTGPDGSWRGLSIENPVGEVFKPLVVRVNEPNGVNTCFNIPSVNDGYSSVIKISIGSFGVDKDSATIARKTPRTDFNLKDYSICLERSVCVVDSESGTEASKV